jgi:spore germination protein YaaH
MITALAALMLSPAPLKLSAWIVNWDPKSLTSFEQHAESLDHLLIEAYFISPDGQLARRELTTDDWRKKIDRANRKAKAREFAMINNFLETDFQAKPVQRFLRDDGRRQAVATALVRAAKADGYRGIDLDIESLEAEDRDTFSLFVEEVSRQCKRDRLLLSIAVHAKLEEPGTWGGAQAQDWSRLGKAVDVFRIMAYDFSWTGSKPGPIAPVDWVRKVAAFAVTQVEAKKIEIGLPAYGYRWIDGKGSSQTWADWLEAQKTLGIPVRHESGELTLSQGNQTWFFADGEAQVQKFAIAREFKVRGFALWRLGSEDPNFWTLFRTLKDR